MRALRVLLTFAVVLSAAIEANGANESLFRLEAGEYSVVGARFSAGGECRTFKRQFQLTVKEDEFYVYDENGSLILYGQRTGNNISLRQAIPLLSCRITHHSEMIAWTPTNGSVPRKECYHLKFVRVAK